MRAIWSQDKPAYQGKFVSFGGVLALPRPVQKPGPPVVFGGMTPFAFRRSISHGNGWYGFALNVEGARKCLEGLKAAAKEVARPKELGELEISVTPAGPINLDTAKQFADLGVHRLILLPKGASESELFALNLTVADVTNYVRKIGETLVGRV